MKWRLTVIPRFPLIRVNANNSLALSLERNDHDSKHNAGRPAFESASLLRSESKEKEAISLPWERQKCVNRELNPDLYLGRVES